MMSIKYVNVFQPYLLKKKSYAQQTYKIYKTKKKHKISASRSSSLYLILRITIDTYKQENHNLFREHLETQKQDGRSRYLHRLS